MNTALEIKNVMTSKLISLSVTELKKIITTLYSMDSKEVNLILPMALNILETKIDSNEFCQFCDNI